MKKIIFLISLLLAFFLNAQQIQNNSFENWHTQTYPDLDDYIDSGEDGYLNISRETDATEGNYSVKIESIDRGQWDPGEVEPGYFINFNPDDFSGGVPYSSHVDTVKIDYKAGVVGQDTALFLIEFKYQSIPVYDTIVKIDASMNTQTWQTIVLPTRMPAGVVPDTLMIGAASSNAITGAGMEIGSWVMFDNLRFISNTSSVPPPPNWSFENWTFHNVEKPDGFMTSLDDEPLTTPQSIQKSTDPTDGSYAVYMVNTINHWGDTVHAVITNGQLFSHDGLEGGMAISQNPTSISYDIKTHREAGDMASIRFVFKNSSDPSQNEFIGQDYTSDIPAYQHVDIPLNLQYAHDSLRFDAWNGDKPGSWMQLDNIYLGYPAAVDNYIRAEELRAFPVPASGWLYFKIQAKQDVNIKIDILDMNGKRLTGKSFRLHTGRNRVKLSTAALLRGVYLYRIVSPGGEHTRRFIKG